ncbi:MAG TPA: preprotein translocase subunit SecY [Candidatus Paceibacterota bacterium]
MNFFSKLSLLFTDKDLRNRVLFVIGALFVFRVLAAIPIPGVNAAELSVLFNNSQFLGLLNLFSGGGLSNLSIVLLGVGPYITASIIMQLLTLLVPRFKELYQEEGEAGRARFSQYSRLLTFPIALIQGSGFLLLLEKQGIVGPLAAFPFFTNLMVITAGSMLLMWIGELISEFGIGNGVSLIIFAGIVARLPQAINQSIFAFDPTQLPAYIGFLAAALFVIAAVVFVTEAERAVPVTYAKRVRGLKMYGGTSTYLPLRLNQAGVIPIIFALSLLLLPQMAASFFATASSHPTLQHIAQSMLAFLQNLTFYGIAYFILVFLFTYFYTAVTFDPNAIAENLQRGGAFIPGVRPGASTVEYLSNVITRITFVGALFLGVIAVLPIAVQGLTGIQSLTIGGTALLIVVSVVLDLAQRVNAQLSIREY